MIKPAQILLFVSGLVLAGWLLADKPAYAAPNCAGVTPGSVTVTGDSATASYTVYGVTGASSVTVRVGRADDSGVEYYSANHVTGGDWSVTIFHNPATYGYGDFNVGFWPNFALNCANAGFTRNVASAPAPTPAPAPAPPPPPQPQSPATVCVTSDTQDAYIFNHFSMPRSWGWNGSKCFTDAPTDQKGGWYRVDQYPGGPAFYSNSGDVWLPPGGRGDISIKFNAPAPVAVSVVTRGSDNTVLATSNAGSGVPFAVKHNSETFYLKNNGAPLAQSSVSSSCASGSEWNGSVCALSAPFNYSLSNSGNSNVTKNSGQAYTQNTITKTLVSGTAQPVTLSLSGVPSGTSYSIANGSCSPTCNSVVTFTVTPSTPVGAYSITVTGSPLSRQTIFNLVVSGSSITASCAGSPSTVYLGQTVNWTSTVSGGAPPLIYAWSGTNIPTNPAPNRSTYNKIYSTIGQKTAQLTVTSADGVQTTCPAATVQVNFDPKFEEF